jgi:hypothetical protein
MAILHPWGRTSNGRFVHISNVQSGSMPELACPQCSGALIPVQGPLLAHHFRHHAENLLCNYEPESTLHLVAKQKICELLQLSYPRFYLGFEKRSFPIELGRLLSAREEVALADRAIIVDVMAEFERETIGVEVFVNHRCDKAKIEKLAQHQIAAIEIDLSAYSLANKSETEWIEDILHKAFRYWLYPPKCVRDAEEPLRQAWIKNKEREAERAREAQQRAEALRLQREQEEREYQHQIEQTREQAENERVASELHRIREEIEIARNEERKLEKAALLAQGRARSAPDQMRRSELLRALAHHVELTDKPPDLQILVAAHNGYHRITPEAWEKFDRDMEAWQSRLRERHHNAAAKKQADDPADWLPFDGERSQEICFECGKPAHFGYRGGDQLVWYCQVHRLALYWADARC